MSRINKIAYITVACFFAVFILFLAAALVIPKLIDVEAVRDRVRSELTEVVGADIDFKRIDLSIFPAPQVSLYESSLVLPTRLTATAEAIIVYPEILPLLRWKLKLKELLIRKPDLSIILKETPEKKEAPEKPPTISDLAQKITSIVTAFPEFHIPNVESHLRDGRIRLIYGKKQVLEVHHIEGHLTDVSNRVEFQMTGASDIVETASVSGWINTRQMKSSAKILLTHLRPQVIYSTLFPNAPIEIQDSQADLTIDLDVDGAAQVQADIDFSMPQLKLVRGNETIAIQSRGLKGRIHFNNNSAMFSLSELILDSPRMQFSGHLISSFDDSQLRMQLEGRDIDLNTARQAVFSLSGKHGVTHDIFEVVKGGAVPLITIEAQGQSLSGLGNTDNIVIEGQMRNGEITIPDLQLDLKEASGDIVISHGILEGKNIEARLGNSLAQNGKLTLGLTGGIAPFHLETDVQADLSQLPPVLKRLIDHNGFQKELALVKAVKGSAKGKLVLGEDTKNVTARVEASDFHLSARYRNIPFPVEITGGNFTYDSKRLRLRRFSGKLSKATFSDFAATLNFGKSPYMEMICGKFGFYLPEIAPWLASFDKLRGFQKYYGGGKSHITLSKLMVKGPIPSPRDWEFSIKGAVKDLVLKNLPEHPVPVTIETGKFNLNPQALSYTDARMSMLDGNLTISGTNENYLEGFEQNGRVTIEGHMGPKYTEWVSKLLKLPVWIKLRSLSLSPSQLAWNMGDKTTISGNLSILEGPDILMKLHLASDELVVKKLFFRDSASNAAVGLSYKDDMLVLSFKGNLQKSTLDKILMDHAVLNGWIDGDIRADINLRHPKKSGFTGHLKGHKLIIPMKRNPPVKIDDFSVNGDMHNLSIESADLVWGDMRLMMSGKIMPGAQNRLQLDMDVATDRFDLGHVIQTLEKQDENKGQKPTADSLLLPVQGIIRFKTDRFTFGNFTWNPLHADVNIKNDTANVTVKKAVICGISTPGTLKVSPQILAFDLKSTAEGKNLTPSLNCFSDKTFKADGKYTLTGGIQGGGKAKDLLKTLTGQMELVLADGHIYHDIVLLNVIKFLNVTGELTGHITERKMETKGFGYHSLRIKANLKNGRILFEKAVLDGIPMTISAQGEYDLLDGRMSFDLLVAPVKTLDRFLGHVPLVGGILHTLNTIPISVKGSFDGVKVLPLHPSAVAYELKELMEIPIKLVHADEWRGIKSN